MISSRGFDGKILLVGCQELGVEEGNRCRRVDRSRMRGEMG